MRHAAALSLLLAWPAAARALTVTAEVNKTALALRDQLVLAVTVAGSSASLPKPRLPALTDFEAYESGTNQSFSFVNGKVSSRVVYTYVLAPRKPGKARVPAITVEAGGETASTSPIDIEVLPDGGQPAPSPGAPGRAAPRPAAPAPADPGRRPDVFLTASFDKSKAYVGEQVTLVVRFHTAVPLMGSVQYDAPKLEGFLTEDLGQAQAEVTLGGRVYHVTEVRTALFPVHGGRLTVGAAAARAQAARGPEGLGGDLFERFFSMAAPQPVSVRSEPLTLEALPFPAEGKPADFSGAVGRFRLKASVDRARLKAGEAATLTVEVWGTGNLRSVGDPRRPDAPALRFFDTESSVNVGKADGVVGGTKVLKTVFVPRASGVVEIPPSVLWHYDPVKRAYVKAESAPIRLEVAPGAPGAPSPDAAAAPALGVVTRDIRYLKARPERGGLSRALEAFAGLGAAHAAPFLALLGAAGWDRRRRRVEADPAAARARAAAARASALLARAGSQPEQAAALAAEALAGYVADRFSVAAAGLTLRRAQDLLAAGRRPASDAARAAYADAWRAAEAARFAPPGTAGGDAAAVVAKARAALAALEARA